MTSPYSRLIATLTSLVVVFVLTSVGCRPGRNPPSISEVAEISVKANDETTSLSDIEFAEGDWPSWRGPRGDGHAMEQDIPLTWSEKKNVVWSADVPGRGHGSPIVVDDVVYLASAIEASEEQVVLAYDRLTGKPLWNRTVHEGNFESEIHNKGTQANGTLACDGERIFCAFLNDKKITVSALGLDGEIAWQTEVGSFGSKFGYAPSPVVYKSFVIVAADNWGGGYLAAVHRESGDIIWRKPRPAISTYSSPLITSLNGKDQLLITGCNKLASFDPNSGDELWSCNAVAEATCGTVVTDGTFVLASGGYPESQTVCVRADGSGDIVWKNRTKIYEPSMIVVGKHLYGVTDKGIAYCWEAETGNVAWQERIGGSYSASPVVCGKHILIPNLSGETVIFEASATGMKEVARNTLGSDAYASLAISKNQIFLRAGHGRGGNRKERLHCLGKSQ